MKKTILWIFFAVIIFTSCATVRTVPYTVVKEPIKPLSAYKAVAVSVEAGEQVPVSASLEAVRAVKSRLIKKLADSSSIQEVYDYDNDKGNAWLLVKAKITSWNIINHEGMASNDVSASGQTIVGLDVTFIDLSSKEPAAEITTEGKTNVKSGTMTEAETATDMACGTVVDYITRSY